MKRKENKKLINNLWIFTLMFVVGLIAVMVVKIGISEKNLSINSSAFKNVKQGDSIIMEFSAAIDGRFDLSEINIEPELEIKPSWINSKELRMDIIGLPIPDSEYLVKLDNIKTFWLNFRTELKMTFESVRTPVVVNVSPGHEADDIAHDSEIKIDFDKALDKQLFLEVDINPDVEVDARLNDEKTSVVIIPKHGLVKAKKYTIDINVKYVKESDFNKNLYKGEFTTKIPPMIVYSFNKDGSPRATEELTWAIVPRVSVGRYIDIDLTHQVMSIFEDGLRSGSYKISTGKRGMDTPVGTFSVVSKVSRPWSAKYGLYMPYYLGFTWQGHGIHELPEWPSGYKEGANHLGIPVSHGCVRLGVGPARIVYEFSKKGTPVIVYHWSENEDVLVD